MSKPLYNFAGGHVTPLESLLFGPKHILPPVLANILPFLATTIFCLLPVMQQDLTEEEKTWFYEHNFSLVIIKPGQTCFEMIPNMVLNVPITI